MVLDGNGTLDTAGSEAFSGINLFYAKVEGEGLLVARQGWFGLAATTSFQR
jgi:hypothetical protein